MSGGGLHRRDPTAFVGAVETRPFESAVLQDNPLGDPHVREVPVYLPPSALEGERVPVVFLLAGFTGRGHSMLETHPWRAGVVRAYDRAVAAGDAPPAILVMPDCFTRYGGSQYVNSSAVGRYEDHVADELVPWVDETYPTRVGARAVAGKSSGGFGALHLAMRRPGLFRVAGSIAGDCCFEYPFGGELLAAARGLIPHDGDPRRFLEEFDRTHDLDGDGHAVINVLAMSACYAPNPASPLGFDLPMDPATGRRDERVWRRWLEFDPVVACETYADALRELDLLYLEAGTRDEFHLQLGLRVLARRLSELGVPHRHVEFDGGHFGLDRRYGPLLPVWIDALTA